jgi:hypothetical protein
MHRVARVVVPLLAAAASGQEAAPSVGDRVAAFTFTDQRWLPRQLEDLGPAEAYVLVFGATDCPVAQRLLPRVRALAADYEPRGARFVLVNAGRGDSLVDAVAQGVEAELPFPVVKDFELAAASAVGVTRTAQVAVLDAQRVLRYRGRVDGSARYTGAADPGRADLRLALEDLLAGRPVAQPETEVEGCKLARAAAAPRAGLTWHLDVAPLVRRHCQECHREGGEAPFALTRRLDVVERADMVAEVVAQQRMPPWLASRKHGAIHNSRGLQAAERQTLLDWIATGMQEGAAPAAAGSEPAPAAVAPEWRIGSPDLVLKVPTPTRVPADGVVPYLYFVLPHTFHEDTWVEALEIRPDNKRVLHHCNLGWIRPGESFRMDQFLTGYVPGGDPAVADPGTAFLVPKGTVLGLQAHYVTTGKPETDRLRVGLRFPRGVVDQRVHVLIVANTRFSIPPRASAHRIAGHKTFGRDATGIGMFAHMHVRGTDMTFCATPPGGEPETLLLLPCWLFDWQASYRWERGRQRFPKGTRIDVVAHYDNSRFNPFNPDPQATVRFGLQTEDEMMYGFLFHTFDDERLGLRVDPADGQVRQ